MLCAPQAALATEAQTRTYILPQIGQGTGLSPDPGRSPLAPYRFGPPEYTPAPAGRPPAIVPDQRVLNYRTELQNRARELNLRGNPNDLRQQREMRSLRQELNRIEQFR